MVDCLLWRHETGRWGCSPFSLASSTECLTSPSMYSPNSSRWALNQVFTGMKGYIAITQGNEISCCGCCSCQTHRVSQDVGLIANCEGCQNIAEICQHLTRPMSTQTSILFHQHHLHTTHNCIYSFIIIYGRHLCMLIAKALAAANVGGVHSKDL